MAAKVESKKKSMMSMMPEPSKPTMTLDVADFKDFADYQVGDKCSVAVEGKVTGRHQDKYGDTLTIEISDATPEEADGSQNQEE